MVKRKNMYCYYRLLRLSKNQDSCSITPGSVSIKLANTWKNIKLRILLFVLGMSIAFSKYKNLQRNGVLIFSSIIPPFGDNYVKGIMMMIEPRAFRLLDNENVVEQS